jgi:MFS family permease
MASMPAAGPSRGFSIGAWILAAIFLVIAVLVFAALFFAFPAHGHWDALVGIGIVALIFSLGSYLAEAASREPTIQRSLAWGFFGMGFAVLLLTFAIAPMYGTLSTVDALISLVVVLFALGLSVGLMMWRVRSVARTAAREAPREAWRREPSPSALTYSTATSPSVAAVTPPPPPKDPPARSP